MPRKTQQLGGVLIAAIGAAMTAWGWYTLLTAGSFWPNASAIFPAFTVLGLALILFPGYQEERLARGEVVSGLSGTQLLTPRWWALLAVALAAGAGNFAWMAFTFGRR